MTLERIAGVCVGVAIASTVAAGQQTGRLGDQAPPPSASVTERSYPTGRSAPSRSVQTRMFLGGREIAVETVEAPGVDGGFEPVYEVTTEFVRSGSGTMQTRRDVYGFAQRERRLLERTESGRQISADGTTSSVHDTWNADVEGRLGLTSRQIEETRSGTPDVRRTDTTVLRQGIEGTLRESERSEQTERRLGGGVIRHDSARLLQNLNGRWQVAEARTRETREVGASERQEDEAIQRPDASGNVTVSERVTTRRTEANGRQDVVIETYAQDAEGFVRSDSRLGLTQRVRRSTMPTSDGGSQTVEELEERSRANPNDPMRVTRRTVVTVRRTGPERWSTERQIFELDVNGRLVPVSTEAEEATIK